MYLVVQIGGPSKPVVANGQSYFALQTHRQELADEQVFQQLKEEEKRLFLRKERREDNKQLDEKGSLIWNTLIKCVRFALLKSALIKSHSLLIRLY